MTKSKDKYYWKGKTKKQSDSLRISQENKGKPS